MAGAQKGDAAEDHRNLDTQDQLASLIQQHANSSLLLPVRGLTPAAA